METIGHRISLMGFSIALAAIWKSEMGCAEEQLTPFLTVGGISDFIAASVETLPPPEELRDILHVAYTPRGPEICEATEIKWHIIHAMMGGYFNGGPVMLTVSMVQAHSVIRGKELKHPAVVEWLEKAVELHKKSAASGNAHAS